MQIRCINLWPWPTSRWSCNSYYLWACWKSHTTLHQCWGCREEFALCELASQQSLLAVVQKAGWKPLRSAASNRDIPVLPHTSRSSSCNPDLEQVQTSKGAWPLTSQEGWSSACGTGSPKPMSRTGEIPPSGCCSSMKFMLLSSGSYSEKNVNIKDLSDEIKEQLCVWRTLVDLFSPSLGKCQFLPISSKFIYIYLKQAPLRADLV